MRTLLWIYLVLVGCGQVGEIATNSYRCTTQGELCHEPVTNSAGTDSGGREAVQGLPGRDGRPGTDGRDGEPGAMGPSGPAGESISGPQGPQGAEGAAGPAGAGCSIQELEEAVVITCGGSSVIIYQDEQDETHCHWHRKPHKK